jgi:hypothetical protein
MGPKSAFASLQSSGGSVGVNKWPPHAEPTAPTVAVQFGRGGGHHQRRMCLRRVQLLRRRHDQLANLRPARCANQVLLLDLKTLMVWNNIFALSALKNYCNSMLRFRLFFYFAIVN